MKLQIASKLLVLLKVAKKTFTPMKLIPVLYLIFYFTVNSYSQKDTVYFNTDGKVIIKEFASFYRVCDYDTSTKLPDGKFTDYDAASQKKIAEGYYSDSCRDGLFRIYDINENPWSEFHYSKNELIGNAYYYYPSGDTMCILIPGGKSLKILQCKDSASNNLIFDGVGEFRKEFNSIIIEGKVENYLMDGTWTMQYPEGKFIEKYKNGVFKSGKQKGSSYGYFNPKIPLYIAETQHFDKTELLEISNFYRSRDYPKLHNIFEPRWEPHQQDKGFIIVEDKGGFPGGNEYLAYYIQSRVYYPQEANENNISGSVLVEFTVDVDGEVKNPNIIESLGYGCDEVVLDIIRHMPDWIPGQQRGEPQPMNFKLPIRFGK